MNSGYHLETRNSENPAYSLHPCNVIINDLNKMRNRECYPSQTYHKEEMLCRNKSGAQDRNALREKIELSIYPLDPEQHQVGLVNVVTGKVVVVHTSVKVNNAAILGENGDIREKLAWWLSYHNKENDYNGRQPEARQSR